MAALPFEKPTLAVTAQVSEADLAERLGRALAASGKIIEGRAMQVIEAPKVEPAQIELLDHSKPFSYNTKHRFRRF